MGWWFDWLTTRALLAKADLPVHPVDLDALPALVRDLLPEWAQYWSDQIKKATAK